MKDHRRLSLMHLMFYVGQNLLKRSLVTFNKTLKASDVDTTQLKDVQTWVNWWRKPHVLKKLSAAYSSISFKDCNDLPGTTNAVESINRQSVPQNAKSVSLKPLIEHFYLEDKRQAILQLASLENVTVSYQVTNKKRIRRPPKPPESRGLLCAVPQGRRQLVLGFLWSFMMMKMVLMIMLQSGTEEPSLLTTNEGIL